MLRETILAVLVITGVASHPIDDEEHDHAFVLKNITALWEELQDLRLEINHHMHEGHEELNHDQAVTEVETLHHEHHVHHLHHPHEGHNDHHDVGLLRHLTDVHGHMDHHSEDQNGHGHQHGQGHSHGHHLGHQDGDDHEGHNSDDEENLHHENEDIHDTHGLHSHEDEHEYGHEHKSHRHSGASHSDASHDDDDDGGEDDDSNERPNIRPGLAVIPGREERAGTPTDPWMHATCLLQPNVDTPESLVRGNVVISQRKDKKGPVHFDLHLSGIDVASMGRIHGFHVHESSVARGSCGSTGGHFNPEGIVHGGPEDDVRHVGDLGNIEVDENGELHGHIISDSKVAFIGTNSIIGKALVLHAGEDDMGKGGDAGSLANGNAGRRLACCTIYMKAVTHFRFKG